MLVVVLFVGAVNLFAHGSSDDGESKSSMGHLGSGSVRDPMEYRIGVPVGPTVHYSTTISGLKSRSRLTQEELSHADPRKLYWAMLKRQSTQDVTDYMHVKFATPQEYRSKYPSGDVKRFVLDYDQEKYLIQNTQALKNGKQSPTAEFQRCVDEQMWAYDPDSPSSDKWDQSSTGDCQETLQTGEERANKYTSDGIAAGGLTSKEADRFISYLNHVDGLFTVEKPKMVKSKSGKRFISLDVEIHALNPSREYPTNHDAIGLGFLDAAFAQTGYRPRDYPYSTDGIPTFGRVMRYYIDPQTLLPAYSVMKWTRPIDYQTGDVKTPDLYNPSYYLWQYSYPNQVPPDRSKHQGTPTIPWQPWPFEQVFLKDKTAE